MKLIKLVLMCILVYVISAVSLFAAETNIVQIVDVQKYSRAIHIMAMLLLGFGFLMVFVKKYGRSAATATYLLVSVAIPLYMLKDGMGILGGNNSIIDKLIMAEFAAASLLIAAGAVLGRLKMIQYIILGILFIPAYALNEWVILQNGFGFIKTFVDTGGSIVIHAFGAVFGLAVAISMTTLKEHKTPIQSDENSNKFSLLGSMVLWMFWPSFCAALVEPANVPATAVNVILALSGSTLATYFATVGFRKKISAADIANAALAGGVAIGSTCDTIAPGGAFIVGILAGVLSTYGFAILQPKLEGLLKKTDTCGVINLHGLPGILGGLAALLVVSGINKSAQLIGILMTLVIAIVTGLIVGKIISLFGRRTIPYDDAEEFEV
ncbi:MAG: ammonium transporter [bacterium]